MIAGTREGLDVVGQETLDFASSLPAKPSSVSGQPFFCRSVKGNALGQAIEEANLEKALVS